jgi:hypothetical protein
MLSKSEKSMSGDPVSLTEQGLPDKITPLTSLVKGGILLKGCISQ